MTEEFQSELALYGYGGVVAHTATETELVRRIYFTVNWCRLCCFCHLEGQMVHYATFKKPPSRGIKLAWVYCPRMKTQDRIADLKSFKPAWEAIKAVDKSK